MDAIIDGMFYRQSSPLQPQWTLDVPSCWLKHEHMEQLHEENDHIRLQQKGRE